MSIAKKIGVLGLMFFGILLNWAAITEYMRPKLDLAHMWIFLLPFIIRVEKPGSYSLRLLWPTLAFLIGQFFLPSYFFIFMFVLTAIMLLIEQTWGQLNHKSILTLLLITPFTKYFFDLLGFPVRVFLTQLSGKMISFLGISTTVMGSQIQKAGEVFYVDSSCMGLRMVVVSFLLHIFFISVFEKKLKRRVKFWPFIWSLPITAVLITFTNWVRITILILFSVYPGTWQHDAVGLICLLLGTIIPHYFMAKKLVDKGKTVELRQNSQVSRSFLKPIAGLVIISAIFLKYTSNNIVDIPHSAHLNNVELTSYSKDTLPNNVVALQNESSVVYLKPNKGALRGDHHPFLCWRGEGYVVSEEKLVDFGGTDIFMAKLSKEGIVLHTAWWYDNGADKTIDQLTWRKNMLMGADTYTLVNVTCNSKEQLYLKMSHLFQELSPQLGEKNVDLNKNENSLGWNGKPGKDVLSSAYLE